MEPLCKWKRLISPANRLHLIVQDLILDILVKPDGEFKLVHLGELEEHSATLGSALKQNIEKGKEELPQMIQSRHFPFAHG